MPRSCRVDSIHIGQGHPLAIITGPCVLESLDLGLSIGRQMLKACQNAGLPMIFKASFDKANRSSITSYRGPGLEQGLQWLATIGHELNIPITTDIHEPAQAEAIAEVVDLIQIPAFLCRQTDLLLATGKAARTRNRAVNIKKGQFLSPEEMVGPIRKSEQAGCDNLILTERGTFFGYHRLVNDFIGVGDLLQLGPPVCFDVTHSTQLPGSGTQTGGRPERAPLLARAATAAGVHALFIETHPDPKNAKSDGSTVLPLDIATEVITQAAAIRRALESPENQQ
ncbi:MAG TPA: 3-deoxy-8-phosphooctulonate synthase [Phycisphaerales bacterium]|nr:3-deoxy-8-phosphooctulonate synthase [Phycisphaerales bacterium]